MRSHKQSPREKRDGYLCGAFVDKGVPNLKEVKENAKWKLICDLMENLKHL